MENRIFISHSSQDKPIAEKIVAYLEYNGYPCWIAPRDIATGLDYSDVINSAIENCSALVLIFSATAMQSPFVKKELTTAISLKKTILPFKISQVELTGGFLFLLNNVQWIDATTHPEKKFPLLISGLPHSPSSLTHFPPPPPSTNTQPFYIRSWFIWSIVALLVTIIILGLTLSQKPNTPSNGFLSTDESITEIAIEDQTDPVTNPISTPHNETKQKTTGNKTRNLGQTVPISTQTDFPQQQTVDNESTKEIDSEEKPDEIIIPQSPTTPIPPQNDNNRNERLTKATTFYNTGKYGPALDIFLQLKEEYPSDAFLDEMIEKCRAKKARKESLKK